MTIKSSLKATLDTIGLKVIRTRSFFSWDPLADIARLYPERRIMTVADVGANVGNFARRVATRWPSARLFAFEPVSSTFRELQQNLGRYPQVSSHHLALGDAEGEATLFLQDNSEWNSLSDAVNQPGSEARSELVRVRRLDTLAEEGLFRAIDLLKTDTEGLDLKVLEGAAGLLNSGRIQFVLSEVGFDPHDTRHTSFFKLHDLLSRYGFTLAGLYDQQSTEYTNRMMYCNALLVHSDSRPSS